MRRTAEVVHHFPGPSTDESLAKLRKKDARLVDMCESEAITIDEFRDRRAKLREEIQRLERSVEKPTQASAGPSLEQLGRLVARAALRFSALHDPRAQKEILVQLFAEVFFRGESITAFRFSRKFLAELGSNSAFGSETIQLETPFRIREPIAKLPEGHKRCVCCKKALLLKEFYPRRARCRPCYLKHNYALRSARVVRKKAPTKEAT